MSKTIVFGCIPAFGAGFRAGGLVMAVYALDACVLAALAQGIYESTQCFQNALCAEDQICCSETCLLNTNQRCGACDRSCELEEQCISGVCVPSAERCDTAGDWAYFCDGWEGAGCFELGPPDPSSAAAPWILHIPEAGQLLPSGFLSTSSDVGVASTAYSFDARSCALSFSGLECRDPAVDDSYRFREGNRFGLCLDDVLPDCTFTCGLRPLPQPGPTPMPRPL
jgi:hypothetical protein